MPKPRTPIPPLDLEGLAYFFSGEYQTDPRYLAHLEKTAACQQPEDQTSKAS